MTKPNFRDLNKQTLCDVTDTSVRQDCALKIRIKSENEKERLAEFKLRIVISSDQIQGNWKLVSELSRLNKELRKSMIKVEFLKHSEKAM